jgi:hypothetical protein
MNRTLRVAFPATIAIGLFLAGCKKKDADVAADAEKSLPPSEQMPTPSVPPAVASTGDAPTPDEAKVERRLRSMVQKVQAQPR